MSSLPQSTYQLSNNQLRIFIFLRHHIGAYHGPNFVFNTVTLTCNIMCVSFEVICLCRIVFLCRFLGRARENRNTSAPTGVKTLAGPEVHDMCQGCSVDTKLVQWFTQGFKGGYDEQTQGSMEEMRRQLGIGAKR